MARAGSVDMAVGLLHDTKAGACEAFLTGLDKLLQPAMVIGEFPPAKGKK